MKHPLLIAIALLVSTASTAQKQLWGMTSANGTTSGTIFKTDSAGAGYADVYTFSDSAAGTDPYGSLVYAADGSLYGMTSRGGTNNYGVLFQFDPTTGVYSKKHDFDSVNGKTPYGSLCRASNGKLYGMTYGGGSFTPAPDRGVLFEYDPASNTFTKKVDLAMNGGHPYGSLIQGYDGGLYGLASIGGVDATGLLFKYDISTATITQLQSFIAGPLWEGYEPHGDVVQASDGRFYGFSRYGAALGSGGGVIFRHDPAGTSFTSFAALHKLSEDLPGSLNGYELMGSPIVASNGKLYGMSNMGGANNTGTIFEYDLTTNTFSKKHDFDSATEGYRPLGSLVRASGGMLYGLTTSPSGQARMFRFDIVTNTVTVVANVTGTPYYTSLIETPGAAAAIHESKVTIPCIYPDPATTFLKINLPTGRKADQILITDIGGRILINKQNSNQTTIDINSLPGGQYFVHIFFNGEIYHSNFVKQ